MYIQKIIATISAYTVTRPAQQDVTALSICDTVDPTTCIGPPSCLFPDPDNCASYIQCDGAGDTFNLPCPPGLEWNSDLVSCTAPENSTCPGNQQQEILASAVHNSFAFTCPAIDIRRTSCLGPKDCLYPNPANCVSFIKCTVNKDNVTGTPHVEACPIGLFWNNNKKICDWEENSTCPGGILVAQRPM